MSRKHNMASPPRSPGIPDAVSKIHEQHFTTLLSAALSQLQDQLEATGNTKPPSKRVVEPSWGRQSPQLTPTPSHSPSPSPKTLHHRIQLLPTPPDVSPLREYPASASSTKPPAKLRRPRRKPLPQSSLQPSHRMLRRSRARTIQARERHFWELDASGRRARRIVGG